MYVLVSYSLQFSCQQNYEEDTQWNDILRQKGIIPKKEKEFTEDDIVNLVEQTVKQKQGKGNVTILNFDVKLDLLKNVLFSKVSNLTTWPFTQNVDILFKAH